MQRTFALWLHGCFVIMAEIYGLAPLPGTCRILTCIDVSDVQLCCGCCRYKELLAAKECPFSFYERDKEAAAAKTARRAALKDPNRFQVSQGF